MAKMLSSIYGWKIVNVQQILE
jgi:hypothetical protein